MVQVIGLCSTTSVAKNFILLVNYYLLKVPGLKRRDVCLVPRTGQSIVHHRPMILQVAATRIKFEWTCVWLWCCFIWSKLFLYKASCWIGSGFWLIGNQRIALGLVRGKYPFSFQWRNEWMTVTIPTSKRFTQVPRWVSRIQPLASCIQPIVQCFNWCYLDFQLLSSQWFNVSPRKTFQWQLSAQAFNLQVTLGEAMMTPPARHERGATSSSARGAHELPRSLASSSRFLAGQG